MQEQLSEILFYVKGALKYKWVILISAWLFCISGWLYVSSMPNQYQSYARVSVDSRTMLQPLLRGMAIQSSSRGLIDVMRMLMFTKPNLEKIAKLAYEDFDSKSDKQKQAIISELKGAVDISGGRNDLFSISYQTKDKENALDVVNAVLTVFSEQTQQRGMSDTDSAQQFIEEQIREYEARLKNSEKAKENFKRINAGLLPSQGGGEIGEYKATQNTLAAETMKLHEVNSRWQVLNKQIQEVIDNGLGDSTSSVNMPRTPEDSKIEVLLASKNDLLLRYTSLHPNIVSIDARIKVLEKSKQERLLNMPKNKNILNSGVISNPYVQSLKVALNQIESERATLKSRIYSLNNQLVGIQEGMDARLSIETEMQNLERDYSIIKSNYMKLINSRETASMTEKLDNSESRLRFKIIDAPIRPTHPSSPNRKVLNSTVFGVSAVVSFGLAFLIYFIRPTFMSTKQVRSVTGLPVLGSVTIQVKEGEKFSKLTIMLFWFLTLGLLLAYIAVIKNMLGFLK